MAILDPQYIDAIKGSEGYSPQAQWDYKQSSSGYGTKAQPGDENIPADQLKAIHEQRFQNELGSAAQSVDQFAPNLPPGVRAALTSLTYNAGPGWQQSGLGQAIRAGDYDKAREIFLQYNKAGGEVNPGLVARRQREAAWFGGGQPQMAQAAPASPASPPMAPPMTLPSAMPSPVFAPQGAPQAPEAPALQMPVEQITPPQIVFAKPRPVSLAGLKQALGNRGLTFSRG